MDWLHLLSCFFGGVFLTNALPHFVSGTMGRPFQTPFAKPPGKGLSSSTVNVLWGFFNFVVGCLLSRHVGAAEAKLDADLVALGLGILGMGLVHAQLFGPLHGGQKPAQRS